MLKKVSLNSVFTLVIFMFMAQEVMGSRIKLRDLKAGGSGCPQNQSVHLSLSPDDTALSVLFDEMMVQITNSDQNSLEQSKICQFTVVLELPPGMQASVAHVDYRGFVYSDRPNTHNHLSSEYFINSKPLKHYENKFKGPINDLFNLTQDVPIQERHKSSCGGPLLLTIANRITTRVNRKGESSILALDSLDLSQRTPGLKYSLNLEPCR